MITPIKKNSLLLSSIFTLLFLSSCMSPEKLIDSGEFDQALLLSLRKVQGKKKKKEKYVMALEEAFERATTRDMAMADRLKKDGQPENWTKINDIYRNIQKRQDRISPLLPLIDRAGYQATFQFVKVANLEKESREKAAAYLYATAQRHLQVAKQGDKMAAREAYYDLKQIDEYYKNYKDKGVLMNQAQALGTTNVLIAIENNAQAILPRRFESTLKRITTRDLNDQWKAYYIQKTADVDFDYKVVMNIMDIQVSPGLVQEKEYIDQAEIEDGFEYVFDENGNVLKDSLGNDVTIPRTVLIQAFVLQTFQQKSARVAGQLEIHDIKSRDLIDIKPLAADVFFENYASTFRGDERALSKDSRRFLGNAVVPFPTDEQLLFEAAEQLKPVMKEKISQTRIII